MESFLASLHLLAPLAVAVSAAAIMVVGWLWYTQPLFGRAFIRLSGIRPGDIRAADARRVAIMDLITAIAGALLLGILYEHSGHSRHALMGGILFIWLFVMMNQLNGFIWRREPFALFLLQTSRSLFRMLAGGLVFTLWS